MNFGVMLDCSRNAIFKPSQVKEFACILSKMGYKELYLYTEDTYEIEGEEYFGYLRGKYTQVELRDIDDYCNSIGIEVVPCIQTLAHLGAIFRWQKYYPLNDIDDILLIDDERAYELIDKMIETFSKTFRSRKIHIGLDEAHNIGKGKYADLHGQKNRYEVLVRHLNRVNEIVKKHGLQPMMWSDMFFRFANNGAYDYNGLDMDRFEQGIENFPDNMTAVYWAYYERNAQKYVDMLSLHKKYFKNVCFAGGAVVWYGYAPMNKKSLPVAKAAIEGAKAVGVDNIMVTLWADAGGLCSFYAVLPTLLYYKELADGNEDMASIKRKFYEIVGEEWDAFMLLDLPNEVGEPVEDMVNPCTYMIYNDYFSGVFDGMVKEGDGVVYSDYAKKLKPYANKGKYGYIFNVAYHLCNVLADKYELGVKTRKAYQANDKSALRALIKGQYQRLPAKIEKFEAALETAWLEDNKTSGLEIEAIRLGGLKKRTESCQAMLKRYVKMGAPIAELEEPLLDFYGKGRQLRQKPICCNQYLLAATVNTISHEIKCIK